MTPSLSPLQSTNDFVVKFANVNGSGSASANELFAKAILRMGVPVSPRNIFPSNIQGLPTWYEVRVSERGWLGRRGGVDLMVAMNPQTWDADIAEIEVGGYLFYDNSKPLPKSKFRDDINIIGVPLTEICNATYSDPRQRQLFKNIMYVGALERIAGHGRADHRNPDRRAVQGQGKTAEAQYRSPAPGPRLGARAPAASDRLARAEGRCGRRQDLRRRQCRGGIGLRIRRRDGLRLVSDHAVVFARRSFPEVLPEIPRRQPKAARATPSSRPRTRSPRSAWSSAPAGTARARSPPRPARAFR